MTDKHAKAGELPQRREGSHRPRVLFFLALVSLSGVGSRKGGRPIQYFGRRRARHLHLGISHVGVCFDFWFGRSLLTVSLRALIHGLREQAQGVEGGGRKSLKNKMARTNP